MNKVTWADLKFPPINLYNLPYQSKYRPPIYDADKTSYPINIRYTNPLDAISKLLKNGAI